MRRRKVRLTLSLCTERSPASVFEMLLLSGGEVRFRDW